MKTLRTACCLYIEHRPLPEAVQLVPVFPTIKMLTHFQVDYFTKLFSCRNTIISLELLKSAWKLFCACLEAHFGRNLGMLEEVYYPTEA